MNNSTKVVGSGTETFVVAPAPLPAVWPKCERYTESSPASAKEDADVIAFEVCRDEVGRTVAVEVAKGDGIGPVAGREGAG